MKDGLKLARRLALASDPAGDTGRLRNGDLRSLLRYLLPGAHAEDSACARLLGMALCEAGLRFARGPKKGKGKLL